MADKPIDPTNADVAARRLSGLPEMVSSDGPPVVANSPTVANPTPTAEPLQTETVLNSAELSRYGYRTRLDEPVMGQSERSSGEVVSDNRPSGHEILPKDWIEAVPAILFGFYGLAFAFEAVSAMNRGDIGVAIADTAGCSFCAAVALAWWKRKDWLPQKLVATSVDVVTDARWLLSAMSVLLMASALAPFVEEHRWPYADWFKAAPSGFTQQQVNEKIAGAIAPIQAQLAAKQIALDEANRTIARLSTAPPKALSQSHTSVLTVAPTDQETELSIWRSVNAQMRELTDTINSGYVAISDWKSRTKQNKDSFISYLDTFRVNLSGALYALDSLRTQNIQYEGVATALDGNKRTNVFPLIDQFTQVIRNTPADVPPWSDSVIDPFLAKLKSGLDDLKSKRCFQATSLSDWAAG